MFGATWFSRSTSVIPSDSSSRASSWRKSRSSAMGTPPQLVARLNRVIVILIGVVVGARVPLDAPAVVLVVLDADERRRAVRIEERVLVTKRGRIIGLPRSIDLHPRRPVGCRVDVDHRHFDGRRLARALA